MLKRRFVVLLTAGALASGVGAAVAIADDGPSTAPAAGAAACPALVASPAPQDQQNGQQGVDEQGTANDVANAADEVQVEADNQGADDQNGDQQGPNDQSEEPGDNCQGEN